jgi:hypothetical protein
MTEQVGDNEKPTPGSTDGAPKPEAAAKLEAAAAAPAAEIVQRSEADALVEQATDGYALAMPGELPATVAADWRPTLESFTEVAQATGMTAATAQNYVELLTDAEILLDGAAPGNPGMTFEDGPDGDRHQCERVLRGFWRDQYDTKLAAVRAAVKAAGPKFTQWLDDTGLGDRPSVLVALSMAGDLKLSKKQAQTELDKLTGDRKSDFYSQDAWRRKPAVARVKLLGRIVYGGAAEQLRGAQGEARSRAATSNAATAGKVKADARAEANTMLADKAGPLNNRSHADHQAAVARWHELTARL